MAQIISIKAREIIDSRGVPTVEVDTELSGGVRGRASVPSGASTGSFEAHELRDGDDKRFFGKGVKLAVDLINTEIRQTIMGFNSTNQQLIDKTLIDLDGTKNKSRLGANAILGTSLSVARAASASCGLPLYKYLGGIDNVLPTPMMNIINGGCHANNKLDFQEFMIIPHNFKNFKSALRAGVEIFHILKNNLNKKKLSISVGDEGGFSPEISNNRECLDLIVKSIDQSNYKIGKDIFLGLDVASTEFFKDKQYYLNGENLTLKPGELIKYYESLLNEYPIISIEDPLSENEWDSWKELTEILGKKCQLVGDDLFVTNPQRLKDGIKKKCGNTILIKLNQIGTLTETIETIKIAKENNYNTVISHRSGETEDTFISDLSVALSAGQIKTGSLSRIERIVKYNQLLRIEEENDQFISYAATVPFRRFM
ncbi:MAG: phosphopyruvate hydratase [Rickettsiales bacterium]|nr:phosphopyruvate hydratase [Rickettsiales bacterium]